MLTLKLQIIVAITIISALCIIINMIRRKSLELRYALSWLTAGIGKGFQLLRYAPCLYEQASGKL